MSKYLTLLATLFFYIEAQAQYPYSQPYWLSHNGSIYSVVMHYQGNTSGNLAGTIITKNGQQPKLTKEEEQRLLAAYLALDYVYLKPGKLHELKQYKQAMETAVTLHSSIKALEMIQDQLITTGVEGSIAFFSGGASLPVSLTTSMIDDLAESLLQTPEQIARQWGLMVTWQSLQYLDKVETFVNKRQQGYGLSPNRPLAVPDIEQALSAGLFAHINLQVGTELLVNLQRDPDTLAQGKHALTTALATGAANSGAPGVKQALAVGNVLQAMAAVHPAMEDYQRKTAEICDGLKQFPFYQYHQDRLGQSRTNRQNSPLAATQDLPPKYALVVIDTSGSMSINDPDNLRRSAMEMILDAAGEQLSLGIVTFAGHATVLSHPRQLGEFDSTVRKHIKHQLDKISNKGGTSITSGLRLGISMLEQHQLPDAELLLLTDGKDKQWQGDASLIPAGVKVHTIAFTGDADIESLSRLSTRTGGVPEIAGNALSLQKIIRQLFGSINNETVLLVHEGHIREGENKHYDVYLAGHGETVEFSVSWPGSNIDLLLIAPDGQRYDSVTAARRGDGVQSATYDIIRVQNAPPGRWQMVVQGKEIAPGGEPFNLRVASQNAPLNTRWLTSNTVAEVDRNYSVALDGTPQVNWQQAEISVRQPGGKVISEQRSLENLESLLTGGSNQPVFSFRPDQPGVYQITIHATGEFRGQVIQRAWEHNLRVAEPGEGMRYSRQVLPFIRRAADP